MTVTQRTLGGAAIAMALSLSLIACGEQESTEPSGGAATGSVTVDAALASKVPDAVKADGKIVIGTDASYAPNEFLDTDGKTVIGFDVDLFNAVAAKLGLKTEFVAGQFDSILPALTSGKYEVGVSSFTINPERKQQVDMISYFSAGTQWAVKKGNTIDPNNACGKRVAVQQGTVQVDDITAKDKACKAAGKPAITIEQFQGQDQATAAVVSGKNDAMLADSPVAAYAVKQTNGELELAGDIYDSAPYGYALAKNQGDFATAIQGALEMLISDGTYAKVLEKWGVQGGAITAPGLNP